MTTSSDIANIALTGLAVGVAFETMKYVSKSAQGLNKTTRTRKPIKQKPYKKPKSKSNNIWNW